MHRLGRAALRVVVAGLSLVVLAVACGGDDGAPDDGATTNGSSADPGATTTTLAPPTAEAWAASFCAAGRVRPAARLADLELVELSGLAQLPTGLWAHNDSGDEARLFRLDERGRTIAVVRLADVTATDWEDLSGVGTDDELFVGDIGDNAGDRSEVTVHQVTLPDPEVTGEATLPAEAVTTITLRYPDGPRDAEALIVDPVTRDLVIVHKRFGGAAEVYRATEADWQDGEAELFRDGIVDLGSSPLDAVTAADVTVDGQVVLVRTYGAVLAFPRRPEQSLGAALVENPPCDAASAIEVQGEAIAATPAGYVTISEGRRPRINRFAVTPPAPAGGGDSE